MPCARITPPSEIKIVPKPWGEERWLAHTDRYAGKILVIKKGHRLSLQYHKVKHEAQYIDRGRLKYTLGSADEPERLEERIVEAGTVVTLPPGTVHRLEALEDSRIFEFSSPELDDVVRLQDDYKRIKETPPEDARAGG